MASQARVAVVGAWVKADLEDLLVADDLEERLAEGVAGTKAVGSTLAAREEAARVVTIFGGGLMGCFFFGGLVLFCLRELSRVL